MAMSMMNSQILMISQKHKNPDMHLQNETVFFLQMKKFINYTSIIEGYFMAKNTFLAQVTFNSFRLESSFHSQDI